MDSEKIKSHFVPGQKPRRLKKSEIDELIEKIKYPFPGPPELVEIINAKLALMCEIFTKKIQIYPCFIPVYIDNIHKTFILSLSDPGTPIGPHTADSISQQATQALLNTFHQAGTSKPGGSQGIKENIRLSAKREQVYSIINFRNKRLTFDEVLDYKTEILGVNVKNLTLDIKTMYIDIEENLKHKIPRSIQECWDKLEDGIFWWYSKCHHDKVMTSYTVPKASAKEGFETKTKRLAIRMKLDVNKLVELNITTSDIANKISERIFAIAKTKDKKSDAETDYKFICFPSPTIFGIIDCFLASTEGPDATDYLRDYFLQQSISKEDFKDIYVSGIEGIENYYPVAKNVTSCIRSVEPAYEIVEENGKKKEVPRGTWVYFKSMRFNPIPIKRFISLCESCGIECVEDEAAIPFANLEFKAHKIDLEKRTEIQLEVCIQDREELHRQFRKNPYFFQKSKPEYIVSKIDNDDEDFKRKNYSKLFPKTIGIKFKFGNEETYVLKEYENGHYVYNTSEKKPKILWTEYYDSNMPTKFSKKSKFNEVFRDKDKLSQYFLGSEKIAVELKTGKNSKYLCRQYITNFQEAMFEETGIEEKSQHILYFISNEPLGVENGDPVKLNKDKMGILQDVSQHLEWLNDIFSNMENPIEYIALKYKINDIKIVKYAIAYRYKKFLVTVKTDRKIINNPKTFHSLNSVLISKYSCKNSKIPLEKPKRVLENKITERNFQSLRNAILLKTFLPFRESYIPKMTSADEDQMKEAKKTKPVDKLIQFLDQNCPEKEKEYIYAETKGSALAKVCIHPIVDASKTYSNTFTEVLEFYGIEALRNLIEFDLGNVISLAGYIDPIYVKHAADVLTAKGKNPFTAKGISSQGTGPLSIITFNKVEENLRVFSEEGKKFSVNSTSTTILIGVEAPLGTGFASIIPNMKKLGKKEIVENDPEFFKRMENNGENDKFSTFSIERGKFPKNENILRKYMKKEIEFFFAIKIYKFKNDRMKESKPVFSKFYPKFKNVKVNIVKMNLDEVTKDFT